MVSAMLGVRRIPTVLSATLVLLVALTASCSLQGPTDELPSAEPSSTAIAPDPPPASEYPGIAWVNNGRNVAAAEMALIKAPRNCFPGVLLLTVGWPLGRTMETDRDGRHFVRDPAGSFRLRTAGGFAWGRPMPADAVFTGYEYDGYRLWLAESTSVSEAYIVRPDGVVEVWPRAIEVFACG